jgi:integrase
MARNKLSPAFVRITEKLGLHSDGEGLYLQVTRRLDGGFAKSWIYRWSVAGRERKCGLGPLSKVGLAEARQLADHCRKMVGQGLDPVKERRGEKQAQAKGQPKVNTFEACAVAYMAAHEGGWSNATHREQWRISLRNHVYPVFSKMPVHLIGLPEVLKVLQPIWQLRPETAARVRSRVELVLDWATVMKYRTGENPARWRGNLDKLLPKKTRIKKVEHFAAMPYQDVPAFMAELRTVEGNDARALEFLILTATRTNEVLGARWVEVALNAKVWTIPPGRMKARKAHSIPLSPRAVEILQELYAIRHNGFVFPSDRRDNHFSNAVLRDRLNELRKDFTVHGFRSSFRDWAAEQTNFPREVCESALAHASGDATEDAYKRTDFMKKRRALMETWAQFITNPPDRRVLQFGRKETPG